MAASTGDERFAGRRLELGASKVGRVLERGRTERVDALVDDLEVDQRVARELGITSGLYVPLIVRGNAIGVVAAHDKTASDPRFDEGDVRLAETLVARAAIAVDMSERVSRDSLRRAVEAQEHERARLARELHDETGQALASILLGLRTLEATVDGEEALGAVASLRELVVDAPERAAAGGRAPAECAGRLRPRAGAGASRRNRRRAVGLQRRLRRRISERSASPLRVETVLYRVVQEALTNVVKHAERAV